MNLGNLANLTTHFIKFLHLETCEFPLLMYYISLKEQFQKYYTWLKNIIFKCNELSYQNIELINTYFDYEG